MLARGRGRWAVSQKPKLIHQKWRQPCLCNKRQNGERIRFLVPPSPALLTNFWFLRESGGSFPIKIMVEEQEEYCLNTTKAAFYSEVKWFKYGQGNWENWIPSHPYTSNVKLHYSFIITYMTGVRHCRNNVCWRETKKLQIWRPEEEVYFLIVCQYKGQ